MPPAPILAPQWWGLTPLPVKHTARRRGAVLCLTDSAPKAQMDSSHGRPSAAPVPRRKRRREDFMFLGGEDTQRERGFLQASQAKHAGGQDRICSTSPMGRMREWWSPRALIVPSSGWHSGVGFFRSMSTALKARKSAQGPHTAHRPVVSGTDEAGEPENTRSGPAMRLRIMRRSCVMKMRLSRVLLARKARHD